MGAWFQRREQGFDVVVDSLAMDLGKARWESHLQLQQRPGQNVADESWQLQADRLDLTPLTPLIDALAPPCRTRSRMWSMA